VADAVEAWRQPERGRARVQAMQVEGKRPPAWDGAPAGPGKGVDNRGDSAHHTDVESSLIRKSLVRAHRALLWYRAFGQIVARATLA